MIRKKELLESIGTTLAHLKATIATLNGVRFFDMNVAAEDFFANLMNAVYGYSLVNLNHTTSNSVAIDLGDKIRRIAVQVTSERTKAKIQKTLNKFADNGLAADFDKIKILIIGDRTRKYPNLSVPKGVSFSTKDDVIDIRTLMTEMSRLNVSTLETIYDMMRREIRQPQSDKSSSYYKEVGQFAVKDSNEEQVEETFDPNHKRENARLTAIARIEEQLTDFYIPIDKILTQNALSFKIRSEVDAICFDTTRPIPLQAHFDAIKFNNTEVAEIDASNLKIKEIYDTKSHLVDPEDIELFRTFLEDIRRLDASRVLPVDILVGLGPIYSFRQVLAEKISARRIQKREQLDKLLGLTK